MGFVAKAINAESGKIYLQRVTLIVTPAGCEREFLGSSKLLLGTPIARMVAPSHPDIGTRAKHLDLGPMYGSRCADMITIGERRKHMAGVGK